MKPNKHMFFLLRIFLPISCCLVLANIYYAQPIIDDIAQSIGLSPSQSGLIVTASQVGYCVGVILLVPMGDILSNKKLITSLVLLTSFALFAVSLFQNVVMILLSVFLVGVFSCVVQVIVPFGVALAKPNEKGIVTGLLVAGALLGVAVARITASTMIAWFSWRTIYIGASMIMLALSLLTFFLLPSQQVNKKQNSYIQTIISMGKLFAQLPHLRMRIYHQASIFTFFTMFWATAPIVLKSALGLSHTDVALISLASLSAPIVAVFVGKLIDKGKARLLTKCGLVSLACASLVTPILGIHIAFFLIAIFLLDPGLVTTNVVSQQSVLSIQPEARSRLNALLVAGAFLGGSIGAYIGPWIYSHYGWSIMSFVGLFWVGLASLFFIYTTKR